MRAIGKERGRAGVGKGLSGSGLDATRRPVGGCGGRQSQEHRRPNLVAAQGGDGCHGRAGASQGLVCDGLLVTFFKRLQNIYSEPGALWREGRLDSVISAGEAFAECGAGNGSIRL